MGWPLVIVAGWAWFLSLAAGLVFVMPLLALVPRLRQPPLWLAAAWGTLAAVAFTSVFIERGRVVEFLLSPLSMAGLSSGLLYAVLARRKGREGSPMPDL